MRFNWMLHDRAHCDYDQCEKKEKCLRWQLAQLDKKYEEETYCTYLVLTEEEIKTCDQYVESNRTIEELWQQ